MMAIEFFSALSKCEDHEEMDGRLLFIGLSFFLTLFKNKKVKKSCSNRTRVQYYLSLVCTFECDCEILKNFVLSSFVSVFAPSVDMT